LATGDNYDTVRLGMIEEMIGKGMTYPQIAEELGISSKTVFRYKEQLERLGRLTKKMIEPASDVAQDKRDAAFEKAMDTFDVIKRAIRRTEFLQNALQAEIGFHGDWEHDEHFGRCRECGRLPLKTGDPLKWNAAFKGGETLNAQITTLMKALGQLSDTQVIMVQQLDSDAMIIIEEIARVSQLLDGGEPVSGKQALEMVARGLYERLISGSRRRKERMPEYMDIVEGDYKLLEEG